MVETWPLNLTTNFLLRVLVYHRGFEVGAELEYWKDASTVVCVLRDYGVVDLSDFAAKLPGSVVGH